MISRLDTMLKIPEALQKKYNQLLIQKEISADTIILGEVGLSGEVRSVGNIERRLLEAEKLGFKKAIIPKFRGKMTKSSEKLKINVLGSSQSGKSSLIL